MYAVIFEVYPSVEGKAEYLQIASELKAQLEKIEGCISIERFESLVVEGKVLSLSFWENEQAIQQWRTLSEHRSAQSKGRAALFTDYRIRVAKVERDYSMNKREQAPLDSQALHN